MFALLNPAALLALTGLLVPVAIHLWNRRPGREVAVGSLRWLAAGANRRLRNLKLEQLWLLLLRAALLAVLAVAVAGPVWRTPQPASRGVVLLSAEAAGLPALTGLKSTIDSLRRRGYALRWLAAGFAPVPGRTWQQLSAGPTGAATDSVAALAAAEARNPAFAWARVQQAANVFAGQPLLVITGAGVRHFAGSHAPLPAAVTWQTLPDTTTIAWLAAATRAGRDSLSLLLGRSSESGTTYRRTKAALPRPGQPLRVPGLAAARWQLAGKAGEEPLLIPASQMTPPADTIQIEAGALTVDIYATPAYAADAHYLDAAVRAAAAGLPVAPQVRRLTARPARLEADWTFWLAEEPLPTGWQADATRRARHVWQAAAGPGLADTAYLATAVAGAAPVAVFRREDRAAGAGHVVVWADGRGRAVLSRRALGRGSRYQLHTRLNPAWSELADDPQLPARLLALLRPEPTDGLGNPPTRLARIEAAHDRRALAPAQLLAGPARGTGAPTTAPTAAAPTAPAFRTTDLRPWLVLLAALVLLLERGLAARRAASPSLASE